MKRIVITVAAATLAMAALFGALRIEPASADQPQQQRHVVILHCYQTAQYGVAIYATSSSAGAPRFNAGDNFAEASAQLLTAGFRLENVEGIAHTFVK